MKRFVVSRFDHETFVVIDQIEKKEICICGNYDEFTDGKKRAVIIAKLMNQDDLERKTASKAILN